MSEEKKSLWSRIFGHKESSACCSLKIEEVPEDAPAGRGTTPKGETQADSDTKKPDSSPCCGGTSPSIRGGGSCCG